MNDKPRSFADWLPRDYHLFGVAYGLPHGKQSKQNLTREQNNYTPEKKSLSTLSRSQETPSVESGALSGKHPTADIWRAAWQGVQAGWDLVALVPQLWRTCAPMSAAAIGFDLLVGSWGAFWTLCSRALNLASPRHVA